MSVRCPHCQHKIDLVGAHAGKFTPKCPQCKQRFMLVIPEDADIPPLVGMMPQGVKHESIAGQTHSGQVIASTATASTAVAATMAPPASVSATSATAPPIMRAPATIAGGGGIGATLPPSSDDGPRTQVGLSGPPGDLPHGATRADEPRTMMKETYPSHGASNLAGSLGGYELIQKLGEGGMGAVYLARQVSLDRQVALKVLSPQLAADPQFVARFTREAYAAAQLSHHNVVQIHDIGFDRDINFFSMELVPGQTLEKVVHHEGKLDPEVAVGYVLQAARGLRFAHDHGLIHRDVKPDNLLLNEQGIVKVADLGLVKQAGKSDLTRPGNGAHLAASSKSGATQLNISMGTPAYMPPEQARDAARVDQRADIYSLGCTLYDLLTGRPPFHGQTAVEVITKHQTEPVVPPDRVARHVSAELSATVMKMMAKRPEDRYQTMAEVVEALEAILGVESGKPFSPKEEHVRTLEGAVDQFNRSKWATLRKNLIIGFFGVCGVAAVVCALPQVHQRLLAGGLIGFALLTAVFYQALIGITRKTHLFTRVRQFVFGARVVDWLKIAGAALVVVVLLFLFNLLWIWIGFAVVAALVAAGFHFTIDRLAAKERKTPIDHVEAMLRVMRLRGLDETALRQFVCKYSGDRWEEMYETLFGYEGKRAARRSWGRNERDRDRKKFGAWRDLLIDWIDRRIVARKEERERRHLARIEAKALAAKGLDQASANRKAKQAAERMVDKASQVKQEAGRRSMMTAMPTTSGRTMMFDGAKSLASFAEGFDGEEEPHGKKHGHDDEERVHESYFRRRFGTPLDYILGPHPRIVLAMALLVLCGLWIRQNAGLKVNEEQLATRADATDLVSKGKIKVADIQRNYEAKDSKPLRASFLPLPEKVLDIAGSYNGGVAGVLLLISAFFIGKRMGIIVLAAALFILVGYEYPIPLVVGSPWIAAGIGLGIGLLGIMFFRKTAADS